MPVTVSEISRPMIFRHEKIKDQDQILLAAGKKGHLEIPKVLDLMLVTSYRISITWTIFGHTVVDQSERRFPIWTYELKICLGCITTTVDARARARGRSHSRRAPVFPRSLHRKNERVKTRGNHYSEKRKYSSNSRKSTITGPHPS